MYPLLINQKSGYIFDSLPSRYFIISLFLLLLQIVTRANCQTVPPNGVDGVDAAAGPIPLIDIGAWTMWGDDNESLRVRQQRLDVVRQVSQACREVGFFAIRNHGVNEIVMDRAWQATRDFFDLPLETKLAFKTNNETEYPYGYENNERLVRGKKNENDIGNNSSVSTADLKETFSLGPHNPDSGMPPRRFPSNATPPVFKSALEDYFAEMEVLASFLLKIFAVSLDLPENWFEDKLTHHISALRILNYFEPPTDLQIEPGVTVRASEHTDYGPLTILKTGGPGLQVKKDIEGDDWVDVPTFGNDVFVVNLGDMMQRWTNDKWVSTLHRVVFPNTTRTDDENDVSSSSSSGHRRQSIAYFCNVNGDTIVQPLDSCIDDDDDSSSIYPPITAKEHIIAKHLASLGIFAETDSLAGNTVQSSFSDEL